MATPLNQKLASRKKRVGKRAYQKKLEEENNQLKNMIKQMIQDISAKEAQNTVLMQQLQFFQKQINSPTESSHSNNNQDNEKSADFVGDVNTVKNSNNLGSEMNDTNYDYF